MEGEGDKMKTVPIQGRIDVVSFANLVQAYENEGIHLRSKSDVLWQAVEQLVRLYVRGDKIEPISSVREAIDYLDSIGLSLGTNGRAYRALIQAESDESRRLEGWTEEKRVTKRQLVEEDPVDVNAAILALIAKKKGEE